MSKILCIAYSDTQFVSLPYEGDDAHNEACAWCDGMDVASQLVPDADLSWLVLPQDARDFASNVNDPTIRASVSKAAREHGIDLSEVGL